MNVYVLRHGQTNWNAKQVVQGKMNESHLDETGTKQATVIRKKLLNNVFDAVLVSPLHRAQETAKIVNNGIAGHNEKCLTSSKHRLSELFDKLGEENLNVISSAFSAAYKTNIGEEIDFKKLIKQHDGAFIEWRYLNFVKDANNLKDNFDYQFMVNLQKTTGNMMEKIHKLYMQGAK